MARRRRGRSHSRRGGRRRVRRSKRGVAGFGQKIMSFFRRPVSHIVAPTLGALGLWTLLMTPLWNGDSWLGRVIGYAQGNKSAFNDIGAVVTNQVSGNLAASIPFFVGAVLAGWIGRVTRT